jgi:peptidoglycan/LPS O-acetylase OafA/YrhL
METIKERNFGLDVWRSVAIFLVVFSHSFHFVSDQFWFLEFLLRIDGVNLFFVLSGFLIGSILLKTPVTFNSYVIFWKRRWYRTIPNYFLFLFLNIVLIYFNQVDGTLNIYLVTYFVFMQNCFKPYDFLFWESWSLCVEEWFYLITPFLSLLFSKVFKFSTLIYRNIFLSIIVIILLSMSCRFILSLYPLDFDLYFRKLVICRLDMIAYGVIAALVLNKYSNHWVQFKWHFFTIGILGLFVLKSNIFKMDDFFHKTFFYLFEGLFTIFLLPFMTSLKSNNISKKIAAFLSKISYSLYLVHMPIIGIIHTNLYANNEPMPLVFYFLYWVVLIALSHVIYRYFEFPMTEKRPKENTSLVV